LEKYFWKYKILQVLFQKLHTWWFYWVQLLKNCWVLLTLQVSGCLYVSSVFNSEALGLW